MNTKYGKHFLFTISTTVSLLHPFSKGVHSDRIGIYFKKREKKNALCGTFTIGVPRQAWSRQSRPDRTLPKAARKV